MWNKNPPKSWNEKQKRCEELLYWFGREKQKDFKITNKSMGFWKFRIQNGKEWTELYRVDGLEMMIRITKLSHAVIVMHENVRASQYFIRNNL